LQSRKRLRYRPGQGTICRFTALYTAPVANSYQIAGIGHSEDGVYFGYGNTSNLSDTSFGILYVNRGKREIRTLTITNVASAVNITVTLNSVAYTVLSSEITGGDTIRTAWELSKHTYSGWKCHSNGSTVIFIKDSSGAAAGTYSISGGTVAGTFAATRGGQLSTDLFIPQSEWNGDKVDGTGKSGYLLDPTKGNVYQIMLQYLGYGPFKFQIEASPSNNNSNFITVHTIKNQNTRTNTTMGNPSLPFQLTSYSAGSTTNLSLKCGSFAGFIEGKKVLHGNRFSYTNTTSVSSGALTCLISIMNPYTFNGITNQAVINILDLSYSSETAKASKFYLIRNGTLGGSPNFIQFSTQSCSLYDTASTTISTTNNSQLIWSANLGVSDGRTHIFTDELVLQPGEYITVAAIFTTGASADMSATINTREDQ
jgi:hypothetical protein